MRRSPDHRKRKSAGIYYITGGGDITLFRLLEGDVSILSAACMLNGMDVWSLIWRWKQTVNFIHSKVYRKLYDESGTVKDYTMEMIIGKVF